MIGAGTSKPEIGQVTLHGLIIGLLYALLLMEYTQIIPCFLPFFGFEPAVIRQADDSTQYREARLVGLAGYTVNAACNMFSANLLLLFATRIAAVYTNDPAVAAITPPKRNAAIMAGSGPTAIGLIHYISPRMMESK